MNNKKKLLLIILLSLCINSVICFEETYDVRNLLIKTISFEVGEGTPFEAIISIISKVIDFPISIDPGLNKNIKKRKFEKVVFKDEKVYKVLQYFSKKTKLRLIIREYGIYYIGNKSLWLDEIDVKLAKEEFTISEEDKVKLLQRKQQIIKSMIERFNGKNDKLKTQELMHGHKLAFDIFFAPEGVDIESQKRIKIGESDIKNNRLIFNALQQEVDIPNNLKKAKNIVDFLAEKLGIPIAISNVLLIEEGDISHDPSNKKRTARDWLKILCGNNKLRLIERDYGVFLIKKGEEWFDEIEQKDIEEKPVKFWLKTGKIVLALCALGESKQKKSPYISDITNLLIRTLYKNMNLLGKAERTYLSQKRICEVVIHRNLIFIFFETSQKSKSIYGKDGIMIGESGRVMMKPSY